MKRFVREFASDVMKKLDNEDANERIGYILHYSDTGLITDFEAVKEIVAVADTYR